MMKKSSFKLNSEDRNILHHVVDLDIAVSNSETTVLINLRDISQQ